VTNYRYTTIKVENREAKKVKDYGKRGYSLSDVIEKLLNYYEAREGKPQKKLKI
jgi:hypothetical protein